MKIDYDKKQGVLALDCELKDTALIAMRLRAFGGKLEKSKKRWVFPATMTVYHKLSPLCHSLTTENGSIWRSQEMEREKMLRWVKGIGEERPLGLQPGRVPEFKTKPYSFQTAGAYFLTQMRGALLLDEMGLGKTKEAIDAVCWILSGQRAIGCVGRIVVVCPNSLKLNWKNEIEKHGWGLNMAVVPDGTTAERRKYLLGWPNHYPTAPWVILNYESLWYFETEFLAACEGSILIFDEIHRLKNPRARVTKIAMKARPAYIWGLTGTLIANKLEDCWSPVHLVRPGLLKWNFWTFAKKHIKRAPNNMIVGYNDVETVKKAVSVVSLRRTKEECLDLPEKVFETRIVELGKDERRAYEMMRDEMRAWFETVGGEPTVAEAQTFATKLTRLRQIMDGLVSEGVGGAQAWSKSLTKIKEAVALFEDAGQKVVYWVQYVPVGSKLALALGTPYWICGGTPVAERAELIMHWSRHGNVPLVGQMDVMGEGLNLQVASLQVFIDVPWTPKQRLQCVDRLHRIGQDNKVVVVDILARDTVDNMLTKRLEKRITDAESLTEGAVARWSRKEMEEAIG